MHQRDRWIAPLDLLQNQRGFVRAFRGQKAFNAYLSRYRIVVEHSLAQMNQFQVLAQVYRHDRVRHSTLTRIVAGLVNRRVANRPLKTYAKTSLTAGVAA